MKDFSLRAKQLLPKDAAALGAREPDLAGADTVLGLKESRPEIEDLIRRRAEPLRTSIAVLEVQQKVNDDRMRRLGELRMRIRQEEERGTELQSLLYAEGQRHG